MQKIIPHLWFDKEAKEAAQFYTSVFPNSQITNINTIKGAPSGDCDIVSFKLQDQGFMAISAGPYFKFNPSISFFVNCNTKEEVDEYWAKLSEGGKALMPLDKYPFSEHYGWIQDKYGLSWQLILTKPEAEEKPKLVPSLLFSGNIYGKTEEAINFYLSVFKDSKMGTIMHYGANQEPDKEGSVMFADFKLNNLGLAAMDSAYDHKFGFNEAISFIVHCDTQEEIDYYWGKLSAVPEAEQCGWLKDKYGISWQIVPTAMEKMMETKDQKKLDRITQAFLKMKKFDIAELEKAGEE